MIQVSNEADGICHDLPKYSYLAHIASGLLSINRQGQITYANNTLLEILDLPASEVLGTSFVSLFARLLRKQDFLRAWEWLQHIYEPDAYLVTILNGRGETARLKVTVLELVDMGSVLIVDRCERPAYNSQIGDLIIEHLPIPVISIDSNGKINTFNQACENLTQRRGSDLWGHPIEELERPFPGLPSILLQTMYEARPLYESIRFNRSAKRSKYYSLDTRPITVCGRVRGAVAYLHELDNRATRQLRGFQQQNFNFVSDLVEETAHKVRNPLTVVKGFIQLYKDNPENIPWDLLLDEVSGIERTMQDFMMFSQNYREMNERVNLNQTIAELYPVIETTARQQGVWIELYLEKALVCIEADSERIKALISNLTTNSLHAMPKGGILTIRTMFDKEKVTLQVADNGVGMSEELLEHAFNPFYSTLEENTGLGLTVCEHVVDSLGGSIHLNSKENEGTVVTVTIPRIAG